MRRSMKKADRRWGPPGASAQPARPATATPQQLQLSSSAGACCGSLHLTLLRNRSAFICCVHRVQFGRSIIKPVVAASTPPKIIARKTVWMAALMSHPSSALLHNLSKTAR